MSYFGEFLAYVETCETGTLFKDHAYRNYDLMWQATDLRLTKALALCAFYSSEISVALAECATRVRERGHELPESEVRWRLLEWYVWRKINSGEYRKWKYRSK